MSKVSAMACNVSTVLRRVPLHWAGHLTLAMVAATAIACGCKRPSVVGEPRLVAISLKTAGQEAPTPPPGGALRAEEDLGTLVDRLKSDCAQQEGAPCAGETVVMSQAPKPARAGLVEATPPPLPELMVCAPPEIVSGTSKNPSSFEKFVSGRLTVALKARSQSVGLQKHLVVDFVADPTPPQNVEPEAWKAATDSPDWALKQVNYDAAQRRLLSKRSSPPGMGIVIAHMDTGYTTNCHTYESDPQGAVQPTLGYDFYACAKDPRDPLTPGFAGSRQPGHGTGTGSLLIGPHQPPPACTTSQAFNKVLGVAPAATLVPVRVSDGILLGLPDSVKGVFESISGISIDHRMKALAAGVAYAMNGPAGKGRPADVISISMGGVCAETVQEKTENTELQEAIAEAERRGIIIVAAAGQYPFPSWFTRLFFGRKFPVSFPGSYAATIDAAGSTVFGTPWSLSSRGPKVDVTAPAYGVWTADATNVPGADSASQGEGTSFSTAITAAVAAMWVQYHGRQELETRYTPALISSAFRWVLAHGGTRSPKQLCDALGSEPYKPQVCQQARAWDSSQFGPGLLDADGVLGASLPSVDEVCTQERARRSASELPAPCGSRPPS